MIARRRVGNVEQRVTAGGCNDARLAVEGESVLQLADEAEVAGKPYIHRHRCSARVLQDFQIAGKISILRDVPLAHNIQPCQSRLGDHDLAAAEFGAGQALPSRSPLPGEAAGYTA